MNAVLLLTFFRPVFLRITILLETRLALWNNRSYPWQDGGKDEINASTVTAGLTGLCYSTRSGCNPFEFSGMTNESRVHYSIANTVLRAGWVIRVPQFARPVVCTRKFTHTLLSTMHLFVPYESSPELSVPGNGGNATVKCSHRT